MLTSLAASYGFGSIGAGAPHIGGIVGPLQDALRAGDIWRQSHPIPEYILLLGIARNEISMLPTTRNQQRIPIETGLTGLLSRIIVRAEEHLETTIMIGR